MGTFKSKIQVAKAVLTTQRPYQSKGIACKYQIDSNKK